MIASVTGPVDHIGLDSCILRAGGLGYRVQATPQTLAQLRTGTEATLSTSMVVREDSLTLYGFGDAHERDVFELLQTISGVGPRLALAMLAVHTPDDLRQAVAAEDVKALTKVPGIGQKGARRIILEIGDRLGPAPQEASSATAAAPAGNASGTREDVVAALTGLGWQVKAAESAVDAVLAGAGPAEAPDTATVLRSALQQLSGGRHE